MMFNKNFYYFLLTATLVAGHGFASDSHFEEEGESRGRSDSQVLASPLNKVESFISNLGAKISEESRQTLGLLAKDTDQAKTLLAAVDCIAISSFEKETNGKLTAKVVDWLLQVDQMEKGIDIEFQSSTLRIFIGSTVGDGIPARDPWNRAYYDGDLVEDAECQKEFLKAFYDIFVKGQLGAKDFESLPLNYKELTEGTIEGFQRYVESTFADPLNTCNPESYTHNYDYEKGITTTTALLKTTKNQYLGISSSRPQENSSEDLQEFMESLSLQDGEETEPVAPHTPPYAGAQISVMTTDSPAERGPKSAEAGSSPTAVRNLTKEGVFNEDGNDPKIDDLTRVSAARIAASLSPIGILNPVQLRQEGQELAFPVSAAAASSPEPVVPSIGATRDTVVVSLNQQVGEVAQASLESLDRVAQATKNKNKKNKKRNKKQSNSGQVGQGFHSR